MNTFELKHVLKYVKYVYEERTWGDMFTAVCASDELKLLKVPANIDIICVIVNTDVASGPGIHWQAIWIEKNRTRKHEAERLQFFDSYGLPPTNKHILEFIREYSDETVLNVCRLQNLDSVLCGEYCALFLLNLAEGKQSTEFYQHFNTKNPRLNDFTAFDLYMHKICEQDYFKSSKQCCVPFDKTQ